MKIKGCFIQKMLGFVFTSLCSLLLFILAISVARLVLNASQNLRKKNKVIAKTSRSSALIFT
jgi:hypothetical protein